MNKTCSHKYHANSKGYCLEINPYNCWHIISSKSEKRLIDRMSIIFSLKKTNSNKNPKIFFSKCSINCVNCFRQIAECFNNDSALLKTGWKCIDLPYMRMWVHKDTSNVFCQSIHFDNEVSDMARIKGALNPIYNDLELE